MNRWILTTFLALSIIYRNEVYNMCTCFSCANVVNLFVTLTAKVNGDAASSLCKYNFMSPKRHTTRVVPSFTYSHKLTLLEAISPISWQSQINTSASRVTFSLTCQALTGDVATADERVRDLREGKHHSNQHSDFLALQVVG